MIVVGADHRAMRLAEYRRHPPTALISRRRITSMPADRVRDSLRRFALHASFPIGLQRRRARQYSPCARSACRSSDVPFTSRRYHHGLHLQVGPRPLDTSTWPVVIPVARRTRHPKCYLRRAHLPVRRCRSPPPCPPSTRSEAGIETRRSSPPIALIAHADITPSVCHRFPSRRRCPDRDSSHAARRRRRRWIERDPRAGRQMRSTSSR